MNNFFILNLISWQLSFISSNDAFTMGPFVGRIFTFQMLKKTSSGMLNEIFHQKKKKIRKLYQKSNNSQTINKKKKFNLNEIKRWKKDEKFDHQWCSMNLCCYIVVNLKRWCSEVLRRESTNLMEIYLIETFN